MHFMERINRMARSEFLETFGAVFEHSPWVAERAFARLPFENADALHLAMLDAVRAATAAEQLALVRAHPELAGREAIAGELTEHSTGEQARLGLNALSREAFAAMAERNRHYRDQHGFPCIIALRLHDSAESVYAEFERRIGNDTGAELANALEQIGHIARGRLSQLVAEA